MYSACIVALVSVILAFTFLHVRQKKLPVPPGPTGHFMTGINRDDLPRFEPWRTYAAWSQDYQSPITSFTIHGTRTILLNSASAVHDLLSARSDIYSDRPRRPMYNDVCARGSSVFNISSSSPRFRIYRRLLAEELGARGTKAWWDVMEEEVSTMMEGLEKCPESYEQHLRRNAAAVIMKVAYGYTLTGAEDPFIKVAEESGKISGWALAPGRWLVDYYPILRFIPSWFPGAQWKRQGEVWKQQLKALSDIPHEWVKNQMSSGNHVESFMSRRLRSSAIEYEELGPDQADIIKWCAGGLYAGATDTTTSALLSFFQLMALYPDVQTKAQAELDTVIGRDTRPKCGDVKDLSYLKAVLKEVLRFAPVANLALAHCVTREDEYIGYRIPKGSTILANIWAILHDPDIYPDPTSFSPERFLSSAPNAAHESPTPWRSATQPDPKAFAFGFGRRMCPGVHFAETSMLLSMANILARFRIELPPTPSLPGSEPLIEFTTGITSHIKPMKLVITPRGGEEI